MLANMAFLLIIISILNGIRHDITKNQIYQFGQVLFTVSVAWLIRKILVHFKYYSWQ